MGTGLELGSVPEKCLDVVVGIDFGTAFSGVSYASKATPNIIRYGAPTAIDDTQVKVPTAILIRSDGTFEFGNAAEAKYNEELMALDLNGTQTSHLYKGFKMLLRDRNSGFSEIKASSTAGKEHDLMDLVVKVLQTLKDFTLIGITRSYGAEVDPLRDVQWVVTVPAIWNDFGKAFMRKAAFLAGLASTEQSDNLMLVLEPEGAALAVHVGAAQHGLLGVGSRFMVLDCGGGTIDITTYEVQSVAPLQLKAIAIPCGGAWGGENINAEFRKFLRELLGDALFKENEDPYAFYTIYSEFEKVKVVFEPTREPAHIRLVDVLDDKKQLVVLAEIWNAKYPNKPILNSPTLRNGFLTMSKELMLSFCEPYLAQTLKATRDVLADTKGIRYLIVVGGFGASSVLTEKIKAEFHLKGGVRVVLPDAKPKPQGAIAYGAVFYGMYLGTTIRTRVSPYTYGVAMRINGVDDVFSILVSKGEELPLEHEAYIMGLPINSDQEKIVWRVFRSEKAEPTTVVDEHQLGTVEAHCPRHPDPIRRRQTGLFKFGGPEVRVTIENAEGKKFNGAIRMT
jgi:molecular chaperone DnaK (HSP70)